MSPLTHLKYTMLNGFTRHVSTITTEQQPVTAVTIHPDSSLLETCPTSCVYVYFQPEGRIDSQGG